MAHWIRTRKRGKNNKKDRFTQTNRTRRIVVIVCSGYCYVLQYSFLPLFRFLSVCLLIRLFYLHSSMHWCDRILLKQPKPNKPRTPSEKSPFNDWSGNCRSIFVVHFHQKLDSCGVCLHFFIVMMIFPFQKRQLQMKAHDHRRSFVFNRLWCFFFWGVDRMCVEIARQCIETGDRSSALFCTFNPRSFRTKIIEWAMKHGAYA